MSRHPNAPFRPAAFPFFYGWIVVGAGTVGMLMSAPGQTIGVSVFTDFLIEALAVSRVQISLAYLVGTSLSAAILSLGGRLYDRYGARPVATGAALGLAVMLVYLSFVADLAGLFAGVAAPAVRTATALVLVTLGFFGIRFFGQGLLTLSSRNMVMTWFERRRGLANAVLGVSISFGFSVSPRLVEALIGGFGWQGAWRVMALIVGPAFAVVALVLFRNAPEPCGLVPDGASEEREPTSRLALWFRRLTERVPQHHSDRLPDSFTLPEARRTLVFWVIIGELTVFSATITAFTFHVVSIFERAGFDRTTAVGIFLPISIIAMSLQFVASSLSDYFKLKYFALIHLAGLFAMLAFLTFLPSGAPLWGLVLAHAVNTAMFGIIANITWARYFGRPHLGAISGFVMAFQVGGSAAGPYLFSLSLDLTGGYAAAAIVSMVLVALLFVLMLRVDQPHRLAPEESS